MSMLSWTRSTSRFVIRCRGQAHPRCHRAAGNRRTPSDQLVYRRHASLMLNWGLTLIAAINANHTCFSMGGPSLLPPLRGSRRPDRLACTRQTGRACGVSPPFMSRRRHHDSNRQESSRVRFSIWIDRLITAIDRPVASSIITLKYLELVRAQARVVAYRVIP